MTENFVELFGPRHALVQYQRSFTPSLADAFAFAMELHKHQRFNVRRCLHGADYVGLAKEERDRYLGKFGRTHTANVMLSRARRELPDREIAATMISDMLGGFGEEPDEWILAAMLAALESDPVGIGSGLWKPTNLSAASLALACRILICTKKFVPKPNELHDACVQAHALLTTAEEASGTFVSRVRQYDAVLLDFDREEWERPYRKPQFAPMLRRMLDLHEAFGDGSAAYEADERHPFAQKVLAEKARLGDANDSPPVLTAD